MQFYKMFRTYWMYGIPKNTFSFLRLDLENKFNVRMDFPPLEDTKDGTVYLYVTVREDKADEMEDYVHEYLKDRCPELEIELPPKVLKG